MDGWTSALTGIGQAGKDKRTSHDFEGSCLSIEQIARMWEKDDIVAKAIEAPAAEAFREGYEVTISDEGTYEDLKEQIEEKLEDLGVDEAIETAWQYKRAYGGSAILLGTKDSGALNEPLDIDSMNALEYLNVFEPVEIVPVASYRDPGKPKYGQPEFFQLNNYADIGLGMSSTKKSRRPFESNNNLIHESRLLIFQGIKTSRYTRSSNMVSPFWGGNIVDRFNDWARDHSIAHQGAGIVMTDFSQPVITMEGLREMIMKDEGKFRARMAALELSRSNARAILLDSKEKFERQTTSLAGVPDILDRLSIRLAAAIGIPLSVLLGYIPSSLGSSGESELILWYNIIRALQRRQLTPVFKKIIKIIMRSLRQRKIPKTIGVHWHALERQNDAQRAESRLNQAKTDSMNIKAGMITPDEARRSRFLGSYSFETQIKEKEKAPGFIAAPPAGVVAGAAIAPGGKPGAPAGPGKPGGIAAHTVGGYARRNPTAPALGANAKQGGDTVAAESRDHADAAADNPELAYQRKMLALAHAQGADVGTINLLQNLIHLAEREHADMDGSGEQVNFAGFEVVIENPAGSTRRWTDTDGTQGATKMRYAYGHIKGALGADGDSVDVYLGPTPDAAWVYVIHQQSKANDFKSYDEDKVMLGFDSPNHARDAYLRQYDDERFLGGISVMSLPDFYAQVMEAEGEAITCDPEPEDEDEGESEEA